MSAAVESVGDRKARVRASLQTEKDPLRVVAFRNARLGNPSQDVEGVLSGFLKITQHAMVRKRSWFNVAVCLCLHRSLTHHRNINPLDNKVCEIYIFIKKCARSFIEVRKLCLIMFPLVFVLRLYNITKTKPTKISNVFKVKRKAIVEKEDSTKLNRQKGKKSKRTIT